MTHHLWLPLCTLIICIHFNDFRAFKIVFLCYVFNMKHISLNVSIKSISVFIKGKQTQLPMMYIKIYNYVLHVRMLMVGTDQYVLISASSPINLY